jgi:hypothetical protein
METQNAVLRTQITCLNQTIQVLRTDNLEVILNFNQPYDSTFS